MDHSWTRYFPFIQWIPKLRRDEVRGDVVAGLTVAVMLVPQGMAYAMLAGLPPIVGLYASIVPLAVYALFGTSRQLAVGPVAMVSLLTLSGVGALSPESPAAFLELAVLLALMVGALQTAMGVLRLGFLVNFLSHPVLSGFTSAAALIIGLSQLKHLLGVSIPRSHHIHEILLQAAARASEINPFTLGIGLAGIAMLVILKRLKRGFPGALVVVVLGTLVVYFGGLADRGVSIVAEVPAGFPPPRLPTVRLEALQGLLPSALAIAFVGFMESISVAKVFASKNRYEIDANQELIGLGLANLAGSLFSAYPVTGGFSRTAVNAQAGAKSGLASLVTAVFVAITLVFLTPLFHYLPKAVLAAIIMTAVAGLVDWQEVLHLWRVKRSDLALLVVTFVATLALGIEQGILIGVGASMLWFVVRTTRPHFAVLGRLPNGAYRNVSNYPEAEVVDGVLIVRMDAQFYFGNVSFLKERLRELEPALGAAPRAVIIDASAMNQLDSSADAALHEIARDYAERGVWFYLAQVKRPVLEVLERSHYVERFGEGAIFVTLDAAVEAARGPGPDVPCVEASAPAKRSGDPVVPARAQQ